MSRRTLIILASLVLIPIAVSGAILLWNRALTAWFGGPVVPTDEASKTAAATTP